MGWLSNWVIKKMKKEDQEIVQLIKYYQQQHLKELELIKMIREQDLTVIDSNVYSIIIYCWQKLEDKIQRLYPDNDWTNQVDNKVRLDILYQEGTIDNDEYQKLNYLRKDRNAIVHKPKEQIKEWWLDKYKNVDYVNEIIKIIERII